MECVASENVHTSLVEVNISNTQPIWKFQIIHFMNILWSYKPPPGIPIPCEVGEYIYFLELHNMLKSFDININYSRNCKNNLLMFLI